MMHAKLGPLSSCLQLLSYKADRLLPLNLMRVPKGPCNLPSGYEVLSSQAQTAQLSRLTPLEKVFSKLASE